MKLAPKSMLGKWSVGLVVMVPILLFIGMSFAGFYKGPAGETILQDIFARPGIALPMLAGFMAGIAGFICGAIGIARKDRAVLVYISTIAGFFVLLWVLAEIMFPH